MLKSESSLTGKRKKKIAIFGIKTYPAFAGADRVAENLINNYSDDNEYFIYLVKTKDKIKCFNNKHFIYLPAFPGKHLKAFSFFFICTVHMFIKRRYDLIHAHNSDVGLFVMLLRIKYKNKIIGTFHGDPYQRKKWNKFAKKYLQLSESLFIKYCKVLVSVTAFKKIEKKKVIYIPNGIEKPNVEYIKSYKPQAINFGELGLEKDNFFLFACGRLDPTKGLHHIFTAFAANRQWEKKVLVIGDFSHSLEYSKKIEALAANDDRFILFKKLLNKDDLYYCLSNCFCFIFPSEIEAMSMVLLEAIASNTQVICSDIDENKILFKDDYPFFFKSMDAVSLSANINKVLDSENDVCISKYVNLDEYQWSNITRQYEKIYAQMLAGA